jgi:hypothetical protein
MLDLQLYRERAQEPQLSSLTANFQCSVDLNTTALERSILRTAHILAFVGAFRVAAMGFGWLIRVGEA